MKDVVVHLSTNLDAFAHEKNPEYAPDTLHQAMKATEKAKGCLLYYFPLSSKDAASEDSWIGWHNDSGFLTALAGDLYVNDDTGEVLPEPPDPNAGLYVVDRQDRIVHVSIPDDCMAVQMGECVQFLTGGSVVATPHCVWGAQSGNRLPVARISLPCFIDMPPNVPLCMPLRGCTQEQVLTAGVGSSRVPPLSAKWTHDGMRFGDFLQKTFSLYYDWSSRKAE